MPHNTDVVPGTNFGFQFHECIRETGSENLGAKVITHEIGHQFGLGHGDAATPGGQVDEYPNTGLMYNNVDDQSSSNFIPRHLNLIRCRASSPGH